MRELTNRTLSISEVLRFANHDFLNQLQLIKMNLDLGRVEESKKLIEQISEQFKANSNLNKLALSKTVEWLQTVRWRFPAIEIEINSKVNSPVEEEVDELIADYLEKTIIHVYDHLDPFIEQHLLIEISTDKEYLQLIFELKGQWDIESFQQPTLERMAVETIEQTSNFWKYVLIFEQE
ncbi:Spo0B domain-containing protein [Ureibacillus composti]